MAEMLHDKYNSRKASNKQRRENAILCRREASGDYR